MQNSQIIFTIYVMNGDLLIQVKKKLFHEFEKKNPIENIF